MLEAFVTYLFQLSHVEQQVFESCIFLFTGQTGQKTTKIEAHSQTEKNARQEKQETVKKLRVNEEKVKKNLQKTLDDILFVVYV